MSARAARNKATDLRLTLPASHQDLAGFLLMTPEHFSRMLREMEDEGIIRRQKGWIIAVSLERLAQEAGEAGRQHISLDPDQVRA